MTKMAGFVLILSMCFLLVSCSRKAVPLIQETVPTQTAATSVPIETVVVPTETVPLETQPAKVQNPKLPEFLRDTDFVLVTQYIPDIVVELKYATTDNFTGKVIYDFQNVYLRVGTVRKLQEIQEELRSQNLCLKIWDGFRPLSAQWKLWEICPDPDFVSHPETGGRNHSRGNTVDVTIVDSTGQELEMPSGFDDFSGKADRHYVDCTETAIANVTFLEQIMVNHGFRSIQSEWWHFVDCEGYDIEESFDPVDAAWYYAKCNAFINLREAPDFNAKSLLQIPVDGQFLVLGWFKEFALIEYQETRGYVNRDYIAPVD